MCRSTVGVIVATFSRVDWGVSDAAAALPPLVSFMQYFHNLPKLINAYVNNAYVAVL